MKFSINTLHDHRRREDTIRELRTQRIRYNAGADAYDDVLAQTIQYCGRILKEQSIYDNLTMVDYTHLFCSFYMLKPAVKVHRRKIYLRPLDKRIEEETYEYGSDIAWSEMLSGYYNN